MRRSAVILFVLMSGVLCAQDRLEISGTNDDTSGGTAILTTPSENHFLRLFGGQNNDPNPHLMFTESDTFSIANGLSDFSNFTERLTILPHGFTGINNKFPSVDFQVSTFDPNDGSQIEASNQDRSHFLGLFSGRTDRPESILYRRVKTDLAISTLDTMGNIAEQMRIDSLGNVGIGTSDPLTKLDVNGNLQLSGSNRYITFYKDSIWSHIRHHPNTAMIITNRTAGDINFYNQSTLALQLRSGNTGLGTTPTQRLEVNGKIKLSDDGQAPSAGTLRYVTGQFEGYDGADWHVFNEPEDTFYCSVSAATFRPVSSAVTTWEISEVLAYLGSGETESIVAPLTLPHGARLISIKFQYSDNSTQDLTIRFSLRGNAVTNLYEFTSTGMSSEKKEENHVFPSPHIVDNAENIYYLEALPKFGDTWDGSTLFVAKIVIQYVR